jgi:hypothetical protein
MTNGGDSIHSVELTAGERRLFARIWVINRDSISPRPYSFKDFTGSQGVFRNLIMGLKRKGFVYKAVEGRPAFYACRGSGIPPVRMTNDPMGVNSPTLFERFLLSLWDSVTGVHDIRLVTDSRGFYDRLRIVPNSRSGDKYLSSMDFGRGRCVKVAVHRTDTISVAVGCSANPFPRDNLTELFLILERVRDHLAFECLDSPVLLPPIGDWIVNQWHFNKDGGEFSGSGFNVTFHDFTGTFYRFYSKSLNGSNHPRLERLERVEKTLGELAREALEPAPPKDVSLDAG